MQIGEAARRAGLTVKTVRYYANIGMVSPRQDVNTGYRVYDEDDVAKLQFVGKARRFNFSIEECRELLSLYEDRNRPSREVKALTVKKIGEIDARLEELQSLKDELSTLAASCDGDHRSHCPILNALSGGRFRSNREKCQQTGLHGHRRRQLYQNFGQHADAKTHASGCQALTHEGELCALARHVALCENSTASTTAKARKAQDRALIFGNFFLTWQTLRP